MTDIDAVLPGVSDADSTDCARFKALPVQVVEIGDAVVVKRGLSALKIDGEGAAAVVTELLNQAEQPRTRAELRAPFAPRDREAVDSLIDRLIDRRFLTLWTDDDGQDRPSVADGMELFYWNFAAQAAVIAERLAAARITVLGVNQVSLSLVAALAAGGADDVTVVDYHLLRNVSQFDESGELRSGGWSDALRPPVPYRSWAGDVDPDELRFIVATSDFGSTPGLRQWNRYCVENHWGFFPAVLQDLVGYVGPLVIPGETACYECLRARQNSHMSDPAAQRAPETRGFEEQRFVGFHPAMAQTVGDLAAMELLKFHGQLPMWRVGTMIEVNLMAPSLAVRKVLKIPRCAVCSPTQVRSAPTLDTRVYNLTYDE